MHSTKQQYPSSSAERAKIRLLDIVGIDRATVGYDGVNRRNIHTLDISTNTVLCMSMVPVNVTVGKPHA